MKILLIRHGESTGNRDHLWAGITDSELTNHGFLQANRLGSYLSKHYEEQLLQKSVLAVYCSDLTRAKRTALEIASAMKMDTIVTRLLREQDLGWREGRAIKDGDKNSPANAEAMAKNPGESKVDMDKRARQFICDHLDKFLQDKELTTSDTSDPVVIVVSHGLFLLRLYYQLAAHLKVANPPPVSWSNTGCTTFRVVAGSIATVTDVNSTEHLRGLKRTRAGVGSSQYDTKQQKVSTFFTAQSKKAKTKHEMEEVKQTADILELKTPATSVARPAEGDAIDSFELAEEIRAIDAACDQHSRHPIDNVQ